MKGRKVAASVISARTIPESANVEIAQVAAMGVAAMAVATELLVQFERKGLITHEEGSGIIEAALSGVERMEARTPHRAFQMARTLLEAQTAAWQRETTPVRTSDPPGA